MSVMGSSSMRHGRSQAAEQNLFCRVMSGFVPEFLHWPFIGVSPALPSCLSFLSSELHPLLLFYCRLKACVACGGYQLMNKLHSSCPVINLSHRSKMKHVDLFFSFKW